MFKTYVRLLFIYYGEHSFFRQEDFYAKYKNCLYFYTMIYYKRLVD